MVALQSGLSQGSTRLQLYPNQFFSLADYHLPTNTKELFKHLEYFFTKDPIIGAGVTKLASYPITNFIYSVKDNDKMVTASWKTLLESKLDLKSLLIRMGLNYFVFGNAFLSIRFGLTRHLMCENDGCGEITDITSNDNMDANWEFKIQGNEPTFRLTCPKCGHVGKASVVNKLDPSVDKVKFIEWSPYNIDIVHYPIIGESRYFYKIPNKSIKMVKDGKDKYYVKSMPMEFLKAIAAGKSIELDKDNLFHFKRHSLISHDQGWGKPLIIHSLQRLFYLYTLRRAQEAIAIQHLVPLDILFPMAQGSMDPFADVDLKMWEDKAREEIMHHRADNNYVALMPIPMGTARVGGDGRAMLLGAEIDAGNKEVAAGMGIPLEFIFGGLTWAGSSISLRLLENSLINYRGDSHRIVDFVVKKLRITLKMPHCGIRMTELRMADDIQRMQIAMQLNSAQKLSDQEMLAELGWDANAQKDKVEDELNTQDKFASKQMLNQAHAQGEAGIMNSFYSAKAEIVHQKILNQANEELEGSMPLIQQRMKRLDEVLNLMQMEMTYDQMSGLLPPPPEEGAMPPEEGGEAPPPEGPPPEEPPPEEGAPPMNAAADEMAETEAEGGSTDKSPMAEKAWYDNPFYEGVKGPDVKRTLKIWATKLNAMSPQERATNLSYIRTKFGPLYESILMYMKNAPPGGTAGDA